MRNAGSDIEFTSVRLNSILFNVDWILPDPLRDRKHNRGDRPTCLKYCPNSPNRMGRPDANMLVHFLVDNKNVNGTKPTPSARNPQDL